MRQARVSIDRDALRHNFSVVRQTAPQSKIMTVVKANAYGHGAFEVAKALPTSDGFAVACVSEAISLRQHGFIQPILVMQGAANVTEYRAAAMLKMTLVMHDHHQLAIYKGQTEDHPDLWLKIDTGMHRLGFAPDEVAAVMAEIKADCSGLMTHFSDADDPGKDQTSAQLKLFNDICESYPLQRSAANSAAVLSQPEAHYDWVRPGIMMYGISPMLDGTGTDLNLQPVMTFSAPVVAIKQYAAGSAIGYGGDYVCPQQTTVAVISCGYGDGYPRLAPSGTQVLCNDRMCKLVGRVSMDMICIDVTKLAACKVGDEATLWGPGLPVEVLAEALDTISYALLCAVGVQS